MRTLLGLGIFICLFLHFNSKKEKEVTTKVDSLSFKQSAAKEVVTEQSPPEKAPVQETKKEVKIAERSPGFVDEVENETQEDFADEMAQIPWSEIEEGWRTHLKEFLLSTDPNKGEEMFSAYLGATQKYSQRVDYYEEPTVAESIDDGEDNVDPLAALDEGSFDPESAHKENLREIFGELYPQVETLHQEYVESIQYLNRSSAEISISL